MTTLPDELAAIVGARHVLTDPTDMASHLTEWRGLYRGRAAAVVRPGSTAEVAQVIRLAARERVPVVPQGGNTGLVGGQTPDDSGRAIVLALGRLDRIREVDPLSDTMTVEAGVTLARAQEAAEGADRLFPLSLASEGSCTIGGNLATNAGGTAVLAYGNARDLVLGLEVVLADGRVWNGLGKLRKDNTGYDLRNLFVGSEGTLGIITAAVLKLFARPRSVATVLAGVPTPQAALDLLALAKAGAGGTVTTFELVPRIGLEMVTRHMSGVRDPLASPHPWYVLLEVGSGAVEGTEEAVAGMLEAALDRGIVEDATIATSLERRNALWRLRETLPEAQGFEGGSIKHDIAVPLAAVPAFIAEASDAVIGAVPGARPVPFGHLGDGNLHFNITQPPGADKAAFLERWGEVNAIVHGLVLRYGGSVSAEHGIGQLKRHLLAQVKDPVALDLMRQLKATLDPEGILNPGKVL
jgi:FAD/FMN-containing dehydrogenase